jgi:hypothetical protein
MGLKCAGLGAVQGSGADAGACAAGREAAHKLLHSDVLLRLVGLAEIGRQCAHGEERGRSQPVKCFSFVDAPTNMTPETTPSATPERVPFPTIRPRTCSQQAVSWGVRIVEHFIGPPAVVQPAERKPGRFLQGGC